MNNNDLKQLRTRIRIGLGDRQWIDYYVLHDNFKYHKLNGPAVIDNNGTKAWWINGIYNRVNGPYFITFDGYKEWLTFQYE